MTPCSRDDRRVDAHHLLDLGGVGDDAAAEVAAAARDVGDRVGEQAAGAGLHRRERQAALGQHLADDALEGVVVGAPDGGAEDATRISASTGAMSARASSWVGALAARRTWTPSARA